MRTKWARQQAPKQALILDADDTLWWTQWIYDQASEQTRLIVESEGLPGERWTELFSGIDRSNLKVFGFGASRFPTSMIQTYVNLCAEVGQKPDLKVAAKLQRAAERVFATEAPRVPGAREVLAALRSKYQLALFTKGDEKVQNKRIAESGLAHYFDVITIAPDKDAAAFRRIGRELGVAPSRIWSVGNSLPSDINPALAVGMRGVWIEAHVWDYEKRETKPLPGTVIRLAKFSELPAALGVEGKGARQLAA